MSMHKYNNKNWGGEAFLSHIQGAIKTNSKLLFIINNIIVFRLGDWA